MASDVAKAHYWQFGMGVLICSGWVQQLCVFWRCRWIAGLPCKRYIPCLIHTTLGIRSPFICLGAVLVWSRNFVFNLKFTSACTLFACVACSCICARATELGSDDWLAEVQSFCLVVILVRYQKQELVLTSYQCLSSVDKWQFRWQAKRLHVEFVWLWRDCIGLIISNSFDLSQTEICLTLSFTYIKVRISEHMTTLSTTTLQTSSISRK